MAIRNFRHEGLEELFEKGATGKIGRRFHKRLIQLMDILDAAVAIQDLVGVSDFHTLKGDRKDEHSMHVNGNWVITFKFESGEVLDLGFEDYH